MAILINKEQPPSWTDRVLIKNNTGKKTKIIEYNWLDDFYGSDHRPVFAEFEIPLVLPDHSQLLKGQLSQEAFKNDLEGIMKINSIMINNINTEFLIKGGSEKITFPFKVRIKFVGSFISSESDPISLNQSINSFYEMQDGIVFTSKHCSQFYWVPNCLTWIQRWRMILVVSFEFKSSAIDCYASVPLNSIQELDVPAKIN